ncbi:hypothetical protein B9Z19DRAFT_1119238 [Tuber borchii]|uniref:Uncharacterized protein n=1 Tax=Tuber borchii TaxID=42251 RepID=A0A2T7A6P7_TUBBO|nr:hypothetical protein B9Z19DRAFT_1119238 [Tuber borchii]
MKLQTPATTALLLSLPISVIASPPSSSSSSSSSSSVDTNMHIPQDTLFDPEKLNIQSQDETSSLQRTSDTAGTKLVNNWRQAVGGIAVAVLVAVV